MELRLLEICLTRKTVQFTLTINRCLNMGRISVEIPDELEGAQVKNDR